MTTTFDACTIRVNGREFEASDLEIGPVSLRPAERLLGPVSAGFSGEFSGEMRLSPEDSQCFVDLACGGDPPWLTTVDVLFNSPGLTRMRGLEMDTEALQQDENSMDTVVTPWTRCELDLDGETFGWDPMAVDCRRVVDVGGEAT